ncbi:MAG: protein kinase [Pirellulaceae bacterium]|nr:protein kinase [Pirellulaceae bacterium]
MDNNSKIDIIFCGAIEIESIEEREAWLNQACGQDTQLRRQVKRLVAAHFRGGSIIDSPPNGLDANAAGDQGLGTQIGPYKLLQVIGEGGMGVVYMAEQSEPVRRKVALKLIKPGMDSRQVIARFEAEWQALAMMDHVNIARVIDAGTMGAAAAGASRVPTTEGRPYFVMELIHGVPITKYCDDNHLTPRQRLELFVPVCQAIQHAHQKGIIHRDIKPSNVMVTLYDGRPVPKVIDFGVAKATEQRLTERTLFTQYGTMVGTLEYMSPEQAEMSALGVDTRSDIYSLGVLLYELLTGTTPLSKKQMQGVAFAEILRRIKEEEPPKPSTRLSESGATLASISAQRQTDPLRLSQMMRGEVDWIVMKTLEKDRNRRYETANGFAADLQRYLNDEPVLACPPSASYRLKKFARRYRIQVLTASFVGLALVAGIIGTTWGMFRAIDARADADQEAKEKQTALLDREAALTEARNSKREADEKLFESYFAQARGSRLSGRSGQRFESLQVLKQATELARSLGLPVDKFDLLRNEAIACLALPDLYPYRMWAKSPTSYAFDFDGANSLNVWTDRQGNCTVRRLADDTLLAVLPGLGEPAVPFLSEDGKFLAVIHIHFEGATFSGLAAHVWSLAEVIPRKILSEQNARRIAFHPRAHQAALAYNDGSIRLFELPSGQPIGESLEPDTLDREIEIALHPTEPLVAICSYFSHVVQIRDLNSHKVVTSLMEPERISDVAWHPNGRSLAVAEGERGSIRLYDRISLQPLQTFQSGHSGIQISFNHAGDRLVAHDWSQTLEYYDVGTGQRLFATQGFLSHFSSNDQTLAGATDDNKVGIWQVGGGREYLRLVRTARRDIKFRSAAVDPSGRLLVAGMDDGFGFWDLATGCELGFVPMGERERQVTEVRFGSNGTLLTAGGSGLMRWPVKLNPQSANQWMIGPPERVFPIAGRMSGSDDGQILVAANRAVGSWEEYAGAWMWKADWHTPPIQLDAGDITAVAVSPKGEWVVTVTQGTGVAKVWDAHDASLVKELPDQAFYHPVFSPDGCWLASLADGGSVYDVSSWTKVLLTGGVAAFSPDSQLVAVQATAGVVCLIDRVSGRELAKLENPEFDNTHEFFFSPDGTQLIGRTSNFDAMRVWDLRLVRKSLKGMDLDWDRPQYPARETTKVSTPPLSIQVDLGDLANPKLTDQQQAQNDIERYRKAVNTNPDDPYACNNLAWTYLTAPESLRDVSAAVPLAEKAVQLSGSVSDRATFRNTLGLAYLRAGRFSDAIECLESNLNSSDDTGLAFDLYLLSMCCHKLDKRSRARDYLVWANRWFELESIKNLLTPNQLAELNAIRLEACELLAAAELQVE